MKASSTFSPVSALVSRNISSESDIKGSRESRLEDSHLYIFKYYIYSFTLERVWTTAHVWWERTHGRSYFAPSTWSSGLEARAFVHWAILLAQWQWLWTANSLHNILIEWQAKFSPVLKSNFYKHKINIHKFTFFWVFFWGKVSYSWGWFELLIFTSSVSSAGITGTITFGYINVLSNGEVVEEWSLLSPNSWADKK